MGRRPGKVQRRGGSLAVRNCESRVGVCRTREILGRGGCLAIDHFCLVDNRGVDDSLLDDWEIDGNVVGVGDIDSGVHASKRGRNGTDTHLERHFIES